MLETVQAYLTVLAPRRHPPIAQTNASHRACVAGKSALTSARPGIPHLDHPIFGSTDDPERIRCQSPDALNVSEEGLDVTSRPNVPEFDGVVEGTGEHVAWWWGPRRRR